MGGAGLVVSGVCIGLGLGCWMLVKERDEMQVAIIVISFMRDGGAFIECCFDGLEGVCGLWTKWKSSVMCQVYKLLRSSRY